MLLVVCEHDGPYPVFLSNLLRQAGYMLLKQVVGPLLPACPRFDSFWLAGWLAGHNYTQQVHKEAWLLQSPRVMGENLLSTPHSNYHY